MKNKKGFTLIEIIICIGLIALIGTISVVTFNKVTNEDREKDKYVKGVKDATSVFIESKKFENRFELLKQKNNYTYIQLQELIDFGLLKEETYNPYTDTTNKESSFQCVKVYSDNEKNLNIEYPTSLCDGKKEDEVLDIMKKTLLFNVEGYYIVNLKSTEEIAKIYYTSENDELKFNSSNIKKGKKFTEGIYYDEFYEISYSLTPISNLVTKEEANSLLSEIKVDIEYPEEFYDAEKKLWKIKYNVALDSEEYVIVNSYDTIDVVLNDVSPPQLRNGVYGVYNGQFVDLANDYNINTNIMARDLVYFDNFEGEYDIYTSEYNNLIPNKFIVNNLTNLILSDSSNNSSEYNLKFYNEQSDAKIYVMANGTEFDNGGCIKDYNELYYKDDIVPVLLSEAISLGYVKDENNQFILESKTYNYIYSPPLINDVDYYYENSYVYFGYRSVSNGETLLFQYTNEEFFNLFIKDRFSTNVLFDFDKNEYKVDLKGNFNGVSDITLYDSSNGGVKTDNYMMERIDQICIDISNAGGCASNYYKCFNVNSSFAGEDCNFGCQMQYINDIQKSDLNNEDKNIIINDYIQSHGLEVFYSPEYDLWISY